MRVSGIVEGQRRRLEGWASANGSTRYGIEEAEGRTDSGGTGGCAGQQGGKDTEGSASMARHVGSARRTLRWYLGSFERMPARG